MTSGRSRSANTMASSPSDASPTTVEFRMLFEQNSQEGTIHRIIIHHQHLPLPSSRRNYSLRHGLMVQLRS